MNYLNKSKFIKTKKELNAHIKLLKNHYLYGYYVEKLNNGYNLIVYKEYNNEERL